jgi:dephospho-CoA kinase
MVLVGITGGLASGKTTVARMFEKLGAKVIDADGLARTVVEPGKPAWKDIRRHFGPQVINSDRTLNRELLAEIVFADPRRLQILQKVIHPRVAREQARLVKEIASTFPCAVIIYDAAMLIEAGAHRRMDHVIVMKVDQATQIERACRRNGWTKTHRRYGASANKCRTAASSNMRIPSWTAGGRVPACVKRSSHCIGHILKNLEPRPLAELSRARLQSYSPYTFSKESTDGS